jgi:acetyl esterase/lipase
MNGAALDARSVAREDEAALRGGRDPAERYRPAQSDSLALSSYLQWIPRISSKARLEFVCWFLRRAVRLEVRNAAAVPSLRRKLRGLDRRLFRVPHWSQREPVQFHGVPAEWIQAKGHVRDRVVLYLHGGGFAFHFPNGYRAFSSHLSRALRARVLLVDYRLAPEHPFPAPQDDSLAVYRELLALGIPANRIVVAGDSAGGNLALGLLQRLTREGLPQPACAVALSPATDLLLGGPSLHTMADADPVLSAASLPVLRDMAFPPEHWRDPVASPLHGTFAAIAPTLVMCGTREVLLSDACLYAQRVREDGGSVVCEVWEHMPHVFPLLSELKEGRQALTHIAHFVDLMLDDGPSTAP